MQQQQKVKKMEENLTILRRCSLFAGLSDTQTAALLQSLHPVRRSFSKGEVLLLAGYETQELGVVLCGQIEAEKQTADGVTLTLTRMGPGGIFADILAGSRGAKSPVTVTAATDVTVLLIPYKSLLRPGVPLDAAHAAVLQNLVAAMADKYFALDRRVELLMLHSLREKVLHYLRTEALPAPGGAVRTPYTREEVLGNTGLQVAYTMLDRGFGKFDDNGGFTANSGTTWDLTTTFPTAEDLYNEMYDAYDGDVAQYWSIEGIGRADMLAAVQNSLVREWAPLDDDWRGGVQSVSGVKKVDDRTIRISLTRCDDTILKTLTGVCIAPLHVYGDVSLFDPDNDSFGFTKGNLSSVRANNGKAVGAGEYAYRETDLRTVYLDANENYWLGVTDVPEIILSKAE